MSLRVAVTGATGFVGRHAVAALAADGCSLSLLCRRDPRLEAGSAEIRLVPGGLEDAAALDSLVDGAEVILHMAGAIRARDRAGFMAVNRDGAAALARARARAAPGARVVVVSSLAAREPDLSPYAASKAAGERALAEGAGDGLCVLRPAAVYGPGDRETLRLFRAARLPVQPLLNGPQARLTVIHARDLARAIAAAVRGPQLAGVWELSDARTDGYAWAELAAAARAAADGRRTRRLRLPPALLRAAGLTGDAAGRLGGGAAMVTSGKVREILHPDWSIAPGARPPETLWRPATELGDGFAETVAWYRAAGWLPPAPRVG
jgi:nucleoside-diphosphate-sugar epimerase